MPNARHPVRELVAAAGIDVTDWATDREGRVLDNPNENVYRSFKWSFGGGTNPIALCVWHEDIDWENTAPTLTGNAKADQDDLNALAAKSGHKEERSRLRIRIGRTRDFQNALYEAYSKRIPVRFILVVGTRIATDDAATDSSKVTFRDLDPVPWFVHTLDPFTGQYSAVRGVEAPVALQSDPFDGMQDPGLDPEFQRFIGDLEETESEALIKARVGQGAFREALIQRWRGCSVTSCAAMEVLVASHIMPWSECITPAERLGVANGLLLTPNLDKLFDRGLITFDQKFRIRISPKLPNGFATQLHIDANMRLSSKAEKDILPFLLWHEQNKFAEGSFNNTR